MFDGALYEYNGEWVNIKRLRELKGIKPEVKEEIKEIEGVEKEGVEEVEEKIVEELEEINKDIKESKVIKSKKK